MAGPSQNSHAVFMLSSTVIQGHVTADQCLQPHEWGPHVAARWRDCKARQLLERSPSLVLPCLIGPWAEGGQ